MASAGRVKVEPTTPAAANMMVLGKELVPQLWFPAGFRFVPTDEELLDIYLRAKIDGCKPPLDVFMDVDILEQDPADLVEERNAYGEARYFFFTKRTESLSNKNHEPRRRLNNVKASWKATGCPVTITRRRSGEEIGTKRILTYNSGDADRDKWSMNEYILKEKAGLDQWVLCTIQEKLNWEAKSIKRNARKMAEDTNSEGKTAVAGTSSEGNKCKSGAGTRTERKNKKQNEKTAPSQPHKIQQQQQQHQEITPDVSSGPPPLLKSDNHALHEEENKALDGSTPMVQVIVTQEYPYGYQHYLDAPAPQETTYEGHGEPPLMQLEEQHDLEFEGMGLNPILIHHRFEPFNNMVFQAHRYQEPTPEWWQQQPSSTEFFPPANGMEDADGYLLPHQQTLDPLGTLGSHGDFIPTSQHELQSPPDPAEPSEQQTSLDTVLSACQHGQQKQHGADKVRCSLCGGGGSNSGMK